MNRYWNLSEQDRAALTSEQVKAFLDVELMEKGVTKVPSPEYQPIESVDIPKSQFFEVLHKGEYSQTTTGFAFTTHEEAIAFVALRPHSIESKWEYGSGNKFIVQAKELVIAPVSLPTEHAMAEAAVVLKRNEAARRANDTLSNKHAEAMRAIEDATKGVWDDWNECRRKACRCTEVANTRQEYIALCQGDATLAETFLTKAYDSERISEAIEWFGDASERA